MAATELPALLFACSIVAALLAILLWAGALWKVARAIRGEGAETPLGDLRQREPGV